jgi:hypothetical protein
VKEILIVEHLKAVKTLQNKSSFDGCLSAGSKQVASMKTVIFYGSEKSITINKLLM